MFCVGAGQALAQQVLKLRARLNTSLSLGEKMIKTRKKKKNNRLLSPLQLQKPRSLVHLAQAQSLVVVLLLWTGGREEREREREREIGAEGRGPVQGQGHDREREGE